MPEQEVKELKSMTGEEKKKNEAKTEEIVKQQDSGVEVEIKQAEMRDEVAEVSRCGEERRGSSDSGLERETS